MKSHFSEKARSDLDSMTQDMRVIFVKHAEKLENMPPRRHMRHGLPCYVEEVTKQARMIYGIKCDEIEILHCFTDHKEYERWYKGFK